MYLTGWSGLACIPCNPHLVVAWSEARFGGLRSPFSYALERTETLFLAGMLPAHRPSPLRRSLPRV